MGDEADAMWDSEMVEQGFEDAEALFAERPRRPRKARSRKQGKASEVTPHDEGRTT